MFFIINESKTERMSQYIYRALKEKGQDAVLIDQNTLPIENTITLTTGNGVAEGKITLTSGDIINLKDIKGVYVRLQNLKTDLKLDQFEKNIQESERFLAFDSWLNNADAMVVNPSRSQYSNNSKLYQTWIVRQYGFKTPESLLTNNADRVIEFYEEYKKDGVIFKSGSSERSKVRMLCDEDIDRLKEYLPSCPALFQKFVPGTDIRVHALVTGEVFGHKINSESTDYRYDKERSIVPIDLPDKLKEQCIKLAADLGLYISGIDLRKDPEGNYYCFEANPSPAFAWYEDQTGQPISDAVAEMFIKSEEILKANIVKRKF